MALSLALHILGTLVWVGGMFFAYVVLRPAAGPLEQAERLALWRRVFARFLPWVGASVVALLVSGYAMLFAMGGFARVGLHVHIMQASGLLMMALYLHLLFAPWKRFRIAVDAADLPEAARRLDQIRLIVLINLGLGLFTAVVDASGRWW
jgi:uncharacterized membrane protein